jgi:hypothetical protein
VQAEVLPEAVKHLLQDTKSISQFPITIIFVQRTRIL